MRRSLLALVVPALLAGAAPAWADDDEGNIDPPITVALQQTMLKTAPLGRTGLEITRVGFGAWAIAAPAGKAAGAGRTTRSRWRRSSAP